MAKPKPMPTREEYAAALESLAVLDSEATKLRAVCAEGYKLYGAMAATDTAGKVYRYCGKLQTESRAPRPDLLAAAIARIDLKAAWAAESETASPLDTAGLREVCIFVMADKLSDRLPSALKAMPWPLQKAIREYMDNADKSGNGGEYTRLGEASIGVRTTAPGAGSRELKPDEAAMLSPAFAPLVESNGGS